PPPQFFDETLNCELGKQSTIQATDNCLAKIAQTHPSPSPRYVSHGKAMHSPKELATLSRPPLISPSQPCGMNNGKRFRAVFFVFSTSEDFNRRSTIRSTYGGALRKHPQAQLYFVLAKSKKSNFVHELQREAATHNDIIKFDFYDNYYNLTLKSVSVVRFAAKHCENAKFVVKMDNDMYPMVDRLMTKLGSLSQNAIYGSHRVNIKVSRESKYAVDKRDYYDDTYPVYHNGIYFIPGNATLPLYRAIVSSPSKGIIPALPFEDAYVLFGFCKYKVQLRLGVFPECTTIKKTKKTARKRFPLFIPQGCEGLMSGGRESVASSFGECIAFPCET
ncbi:Beta-1,3-galactosyltransferase 5, partial [Tyrophagus putrescentiae]